MLDELLAGCSFHRGLKTAGRADGCWGRTDLQRVSWSNIPLCHHVTHTHEVWTPPQPPSCYIMPQNINLTHHIHPLCVRTISVMLHVSAHLVPIAYTSIQLTNFQRMLLCFRFVNVFNTFQSAICFHLLKWETQDTLIWQKILQLNTGSFILK